MPEVLSLVKNSYNELEPDLGDITPFRNNISMMEVFGEVWHWIFGQTNRLLVDRGIIYDPPIKCEGESRHISWVSEFNP